MLACLGVIGCTDARLDLLETNTVAPRPSDNACAELDQAECAARMDEGCAWGPRLSGCLSSDAACTTGQCLQGDLFVRRAGQRLLLGGEPFRFVGVGAWSFTRQPGCEWAAGLSWIQRAFDDLVQANVTVLRLYAFQPGAGPTASDFSRLDQLVSEARRSGIRLLLLLEDTEGSCSGGKPRDDEWFASGYREPEPSRALSYRDWAVAVARRYRDEPTVLGYTPVHQFHGDNPSVLLDFVQDIGAALKAEAGNQLLTLDASLFSPATTIQGQPSPFERLQALDLVDVVDVADYSDQGLVDPALVESVQPLSASLGKPAIVNEVAVSTLDASPAALAARAARVDERLTALYVQGFAGALLWDFTPGWRTPLYSFDARADEPLMGPSGVLARAPW
jgi:hypothetical protein